MLISYDLLYELEAVLLRPWFRRKLTYSDVLEYVLWIREGATLVAEETPGVTVEGSPDPGDDYLFSLAFIEQSYLVSGDPHISETEALGPFQILTPRRFWDDVLGTSR
jgi:predicted nucleic acid-binding protein